MIRYLGTWERIFLVVWFFLVSLAPFVIGAIILGTYLGWWTV